MVVCFSTLFSDELQAGYTPAIGKRKAVPGRGQRPRNIGCPLSVWHNPLQGFGRGLATIATEQNPGASNALVLAEKRRRDEEAATSGAIVAAASS
jgi:hypothetical protein